MSETLSVLNVAFEKQIGTASFAPYIQCSLHALTGYGSRDDITIPCRVDTGTDITCIPIAAAEHLMPLLLGKSVLVRGYLGRVTREKTYLMNITLRDKEGRTFANKRPSRGVLLTDSDIGLLGMDVLQDFKVVIDNITQRCTLMLR